ncbi:MAG: hypothetical protein BWX70_00134 [Verrucomicrobia bacterium ADurb.Bin070]|nr:MAG: hypothetical protein BWX70_00134 [Verrucomicrobia bacterium ADurb.Bin070]
MRPALLEANDHEVIVPSPPREPSSASGGLNAAGALSESQHTPAMQIAKAEPKPDFLSRGPLSVNALYSSEDMLFTPCRKI